MQSPPPFQAPCHPCIYASNEEHFAAYRELRYFVVMRLVGWISHLDFLGVEQHGGGTMNNKKKWGWCQGI